MRPWGRSTSEALAVGDDGEVARYVVAEVENQDKEERSRGWQPEPLLGASGLRHAPPASGGVADARARLRRRRAGEMWLWRKETGRGKRPCDAAELPRQPAGDRLRPTPTRRPTEYAVGQQGVLLRYGKTWTQEPESSIAAEAQGASFTSVAFAGSEAIVAFRK